MRKKAWFLAIFLMFLQFQTLMAQNISKQQVLLGAYYFNGWTGKTNHLTSLLTKSFNSRKPIWGWLAGNSNTMKKEISYASNSGIRFFSFCWYYVNSDSTRYKDHPLNNGLSLFLNSSNRSLLKFNLLVANHEGAVIRPSDWNTVTREWISLFKQPNYLLVDGKPLITFFSLKTLTANFRTAIAIREALNSFRRKAVVAGLKGISIAICVNGSDEEISLAESCGFDILTGYNYHYVGFKKDRMEVPIDSLIAGSTTVWDKAAKGNLPYIPAVTLNWDPRPWASMNRENAKSPRYVGFSSSSVYKSIQSAKNWIHMNADRSTKEKIVVVYAWNEYGEGAWLSPTNAKGNTLLNSVKKALR